MTGTLDEVETIARTEGDAASPGGFRAAGIHSGLKRDKPDLAGTKLAQTDAKSKKN